MESMNDLISFSPFGLSYEQSTLTACITPSSVGPNSDVIEGMLFCAWDDVPLYSL